MAKADHLRKVQAGDEFDMPARTFNAFVDAAQAGKVTHLGLPRAAGQSRRTNGPLPVSQPRSTVLVKNSSGGDLGRFSILGIDDALWDPTEQPGQFQSQEALQLVLIGDTPALADHLGRFVILAGPIAAGAIGPAWLDGICPARVDVDDADHPFCDIKDASTGALQSGFAGGARILWKPAGTGDGKWCYIRLGDPGAQTIQHATVQTQAASHGGLYTLRPLNGDGGGADDIQAQRVDELGTSCVLELADTGRYVSYFRNLNPDGTFTADYGFRVQTWGGGQEP